MKRNRIRNADDPTKACMKDIISANSQESYSAKERKKMLRPMQGLVFGGMTSLS